MNAALLAVISIMIFWLGYRFYGGFLANKLFGQDDDFKTPAHEFKDGIDYVPSNKHVLFGHHFTSIAGAAPIVGPALGVIWGWVPAMIWVVFGSIFIGGVHDLGCLILSAKNKARSVADLAGVVISTRVRVLFLLLVMCLLWLVLAVFAFIIGWLFQKYPATVLPINFQIVVAVVIGFTLYKLKIPLFWPSLAALLLLYAGIFPGVWSVEALRIGNTQDFHPIFDSANAMGLGIGGVDLWIIILLIYAFIASLLPVWILLQPRDYINSLQLFVALGALYIGLFICHPEMPPGTALNTDVEGAIPIFPFLFVTIACGAISGFHSLVGSGTSSKQLNTLKDAHYIGYGSMIAEGLLAVIAILACTAGFANKEAWQQHYCSWDAARGLGPKISAFIEGGSSFLNQGFSIVSGLELPAFFAPTMLAIVVISFAATTLDSACRIQRYIIGELGGALKIKMLKNRYLGAAIAAFTPLILAFMKASPGAGGNPKAYWQLVWPIFGACNQMLAALALLLLTLYLACKGKKYIYTLIPFIFMTAITATAMACNIKEFLQPGPGLPPNYLLLVISVALLALSLWITVEGILLFLKARSAKLSLPDLN
ncbi:carbon starvation protein A [Planctomycetota bacterium]